MPTGGCTVQPIHVRSSSVKASLRRSKLLRSSSHESSELTGHHAYRWVNAFLHRVRMLRHFGVTPYMVFDGDYLPSKAATEDSRAKKRDEKRKLAAELLKAGKPAQAAQEFQKCIDITPEMASTLIVQLKKMDIPYVVAPYEADAQLVYLERQGFISGILSDDSDLLVFGAKRLLTKLDQYGNCIEINRRDFCACREISLTGWTDAEFRHMAIMSGCDYLDSLPGVGLKTAYRMLRKTKSPERIVRLLQFEGKRVSENYLTRFYQAELTFLHQWVFCPKKKELVHLTDLDGSRTAEEMPFIGAHVEPELARAVASGDVDPISKLPIVLVPTTPSKRRHSQTTTAVSSQPALKPINSYFKGQHSRVPMGEMDPNCFSVDRQTLSQITGGGLVPRVFPLPRPYIEGQQPAMTGQSRRHSSAPVHTSPRLQRRRTEPISNLLSKMSSSPVAPQHTESSSTSASSSAVTPRSDPPNRPPKKARLCEESEEKNASPTNSKFFPVKNSLKAPRRARSDAYLLSDDSLDEALCSLPDIGGWEKEKSTRKPIRIFVEESSQGQNLSQVSTQENTSQETQATSACASQEHDVKNDASIAPIKSSMQPPKLPAPVSRTLTTPLRSDLRHFSYSTMCSTTPGSAASSVFSTIPTPSTAPSTAKTRISPLQRLGARAVSAPISPKPKPRQSSRKNYLAGLPVNPAFVPLPKVDLDEVEALNRSCGSEDQIIPDSDEECEEDDIQLPTKRLNLSRFVFS